jgi:hypothetical protein
VGKLQVQASKEATVRMHEEFRRRVRIIGKPDNVTGWAVTIIDTETDETIEAVNKAVITLIAGEVNMVELTYYETDEANHIVVQDGEPIIKRIKLQHPEIDLYALERIVT